MNRLAGSEAPAPAASTCLCSSAPRGEMLPDSFLCYGCGMRIQEISRGAGFERCGAVEADRKYRLCRHCLSRVMEFLEGLFTQVHEAR